MMQSMTSHVKKDLFDFLPLAMPIQSIHLNVNVNLHYLYSISSIERVSIGIRAASQRTLNWRKGFTLQRQLYELGHRETEQQ